MKESARKLAILAILFLFPFSQTQAQLPGFDVPLAGDEAIGLAAGDQRSPVISTGDGTQLVVWADERSNPYAYYEYETSSDIYAMRLDSNGQKLDAVPFIISAQRGAQTNPKVVWNGTQWLVVFESVTVSGTGYYFAGHLESVRVNQDGSLMDDHPVPLFGLTPGQWALASDGNQWVIVAEGNSVSGDIFAIRVAADGTVLDSPTTSLVEETYFTRSGIRLAHAGGVFMMTLDDPDGTVAVRFNSDLILIDTMPYLLLDRSIGALDSSGSDFYIAWDHQRPDFSRVIRGSRVNPSSGVMLDGAGVDISGNFPLDASRGGIGVAWDSANWRISWPNGGTRIARVNAAGTVVNPGGNILPDVTAGATAGTSTQGVQFTWSDFDNNEYDVYAAAIDLNDVVSVVDDMSIGTPRQNRSDLTAGNDGYMAVFRSVLAGQVRILAQPLDSAGNSLLAEPIQLDTGTNLFGPGSPAVAWNGSHYMVSWSNSDGVVASRILQNGTVLDTSPVVVMSPAHGPVDIAALGNDFLVAAMRISGSSHFIVPVSARISGSGIPLGDPLVLGAYFVRTIAVTELDGRWLVTWHRNVSHDDSLAETRAAFVNADGTLGDQFQVHGYFSTTGGNSVFTIGLAAGGGKALLVQSQELSSGVETDLLSHLVHPDSSVEPMINLTPWAGNQYRPEVSFDDRDFIVVYQDQKNRVAQSTLDQLDARSDIYGIRINPDGTVIDPQGFLVANSPLGETDPVVASRGSDTLIAASQMLNDGVHASYRVQLSEVLNGANRFPVAVAGASPTGGDVPLTVDFSSAGSVDPEGSTLSYLWQFADGISSTQSNPSHPYGVSGEYQAILTVFDSIGQPASQGVSVVATNPNQLPVAVASASQLTGPAPLSTILSADGSYDPDGHIGNIEWTSSDGRNYFGSPAYFTFSTAGSYTVTLRVNDSRGAFAEDTLNITVVEENLPPTAVASATPVSGEAPLSVSFNSSGSNDPDGNIASYSWDYGDSSSGSGANPTHLYSSQGMYTAVLTVTDNSGASDSASVIIEVSGISGTALRSSIAMSSSKKRGLTSVNATVTVTNGDGGVETSAIVQGKWTLPDNSIFSRYEYSDRKGKASFSTAAVGDGIYSFEILTLTKSGFVWDKGGSETLAAFTLGDGPANQPPVAFFTDNCNALSCVFDASASSDPDGSIVAYTWTFGDGGTASGVNPSHVYSAAGSYPLTLTVTDDDGDTDTSNRTLTVSDDPVPTTVVHIGDLDGVSATAPRNRWISTVSVLVHNDGHTVVSGATVSGIWSNGANGSGSCSTGAVGWCEISKSNIKSNVSSVTFTVTDVSLPNGSYDAGINHDIEPDSNGTGILIQR